MTTDDKQGVTSAPTAKATYTADSITLLKGLEGVRARPGMYIGGTDTKGMHHILWEIIDNSMDELTNGFGDRIEIIFYADGSVSVEDNGRGIPVDINRESKINGVELVFTKLHAGGKFGNNNYNYSGGLHGVGASVTNALSEWLEVEVYRGGKTYAASFYSHAGEDGKIISGDIKEPLHVVSGVKTTKQGSFVHFLPDPRVFNKGSRLSFTRVVGKMRELAFLNKGIKISVIDRRTPAEGESETRIDMCYEGGLKDFVKWINSSNTVLYEEPVYISRQYPNFELEIAVQHTDAYDDVLFSYVNNIPTTDGGYHETGFKTAYTKCFNDYARRKGVLKEKDENLLGDDYREGLVAVVSVKMQDAEFDGQTKSKLGNIEVKSKVETIVTEELTAMMKAKEFKQGDIILQKAQDAARARVASRQAKERERLKKGVSNVNLVGKLSNCSGKKAELNELFIVEGDSAGGSAKQGRDPKTQAILPLRGKPLNVQKKRLDQILQNEEIRSMIHAIGVGIEERFDINHLNYHKIIILADADQDGAHIRAILITFFYRFMREVISNGHLYIGMPPLYKVEKGDRIRYAYDDNELEIVIQEMGRGYKLQRYKGLGEMNPEQLWATTMNPAGRTLARVTIEDGAEAERLITTLMGDDIESRKRYINENANFNKTDDFIKKMQ